MRETYNDGMPLFQRAHDFEIRQLQMDGDWFTVFFKCLGHEHELTTISASDAFIGLISICNELHSYYKGDLHSDDSREFGLNCEWHDEECTYDWSFWPRTGGLVNVRMAVRSGPETINCIRVYPIITLVEFSIPCDTLLNQWYNISKSVLLAHGLIGYRNQSAYSEFPLRDFRDLHEAVTGEIVQAKSIEDDIRFLSRIAAVDR